MRKMTKRTKILLTSLLLLLCVFIAFFFISNKEVVIIEEKAKKEITDKVKDNNEGEKLNELLKKEGIEVVTKENASLTGEEDIKVDKEINLDKDKDTNKVNTEKLDIVSNKKTVKPKNDKDNERVVVKNKSKDVVVTENKEKGTTEMKDENIKVIIPTNVQEKNAKNNEVKKEKPKDEPVIKLPPPQSITKEETKKDNANTIKIKDLLVENGYETVSSKEGNAFVVKKDNKIEYMYSEDKSLKMKFFAIKEFGNDKSLEIGAKMLIDLGVNMSVDEIVKNIKTTLSSETGEYITKGITFYHTGTEIAIDF